MRRDTTSWYSHNLGMEMPFVAYGHAGYPLLMFPTAAADYLEYERFLLTRRDQAFHRSREYSRLFDKFGQSLQFIERQSFAAVESRTFNALRPLRDGRSFAVNSQ